MPSHQELIALGKKALRAEDAHAAVDAFRKALEQKPDDANTLLLLAQALERDEQLPQAQKAWLWCASRVPSPTTPLQRALAVSLRRKNVEATHKLLQSITTEYPGLLTFKAQLARLELGRGHIDACLELALALIDEAVAANDVLHHAEGNLLAGLGFLLGSKPTYAEKHLMLARELKPDSVEPWLALASLRSRKKDRVRAEQILSEAVRKFPKEFGPANDLALLYLKSKDAEKRQQAIPLFERAALNAPDNKDVYLNLAMAWYPQNRERAKWCAQKAMLSSRPTTRAEAKRLLGLIDAA